jgi:hypothetical protein
VLAPQHHIMYMPSALTDIPIRVMTQPPGE